MRILLAPIIVLPLMLSLPAFAQGTHSADQIINSLRPTGNLIQGGTRGIRAPSRPTPTQETASTANQKGQAASHQGND